MEASILIPLLFMAILAVLVVILAVICVRKGSQISSLKKQVTFLEENLQEFIEKEKRMQSASRKRGRLIDFPSPRSLH